MVTGIVADIIGWIGVIGLTLGLTGLPIIYFIEEIFNIEIIDYWAQYKK